MVPILPSWVAMTSTQLAKRHSTKSVECPPTRERIVGHLKSTSRLRNDCRSALKRQKVQTTTSYSGGYQHVTHSQLYVYHPPITVRSTAGTTTVVVPPDLASDFDHTNPDHQQRLLNSITTTTTTITTHTMATLQPSPRGRVRSASTAGRESGPFEAHRVAFAGHLLELHRLVGGYYEANARDPIGSTPLHHAAQVRCSPALSRLVALCA
jgi:hypothetical protein